MTPRLWKKLLRDLWERLGAVLALVAIVAVGISSFTGPASLYQDLSGARDGYYRRTRLADLVVDVRRAPDAVEERLREVPGVARLRTRVREGALFEVPGVPEPVTGFALSHPEDGSASLNDLHLRRGTLFTGGRNEALLEEQFARARGYEVGDPVRVTVAGRQEELTVVGTVLAPEFVWLVPPGGGFAPDPARVGVVWVPRDELAEWTDRAGAFDQVLAQVHDPRRARVEEVLEELERALEPYGVVDGRPMADEASVRMLDDEIAGLAISTTVTPAIFLVVAALVLQIMIRRVVAQQRSVIGTLRALGYTRGQLARHYLGFGLVVGALGGVLGVAGGRAMQLATVDVYRQFFALPRIDAGVYPEWVLGGVGLAVGFALLGALRGVRAVTELDPAEAMRPAPPERGGRVLIERLPVLWDRLGFRARMALRAVFRNPGRSLVSVLASFLASSLMLMSLCLLDEVDHLMTHTFQRMAREDFSVDLRDPVAAGALREVAQVPGVTDVEGQLMVPADLARGPRSRRVGVTGVRPGSYLHLPLDEEGRAVAVPDRGLVLTRKLAELLEVGRGDAVRLRPQLGERRAVTVTVAGVVETYLGLSAYADAAFLARLLGEEDVVSRILVRTRDPDGAAAAMAGLQDRPAVSGVGSRRRSLHHLEETFGDVQNVSIGVLVFFAGLIAFGSVLNASLVSLSERRREVGTLRVLGYHPEQVAWLFDAESLVVNGAGALLGLLGGVGLLHLISRAYDTEVYRFPVVVHPFRLVETLVLMALFVGAAQLLVHRVIRRLDWLEALSVKE